MKGFWFIPGVAALAAAAGTAWGLRARMRPPKKEQTVDRDVLLDGLARHAPLYDGLYEGIYQAARQENAAGRDAIREFCDRTAGLEEDGTFSHAFAARFAGSVAAEQDAYREKMEELLALFQAAGIVRAEETELALSPQIRREYIYLGEPVPDDGVVCRVMKPKWSCQERLVEQGILMKREDAQ